MMKYVYILRSFADGREHYYTGMTDDLRERLKMHNGGKVAHTAKFMPWELKTYMAFDDAERAAAFEDYLKTSSGRAFAKKRL